MKKLTYAGCALILAGALSAQAGVIAAWDMNGAVATTSPGWTGFALGSNNTDTVNFTGDEYLGDGSITLRQTTDIGILRTRDPLIYLTNAVPLLAAGNDVFNDGTDVDDYELSGLTEGQWYRLQFVGTIHKLQTGRNLVLTVDSKTAGLFADPAVGDGSNPYGGYSEYLTFTADATGTVALDFSGEGAGQKAMGGIIVETIPEPATIGMIGFAGTAIMLIRRRIRS